MARTVRLRLSGDLEKLVQELEQQGMTEEEILGKALSLLEMAHNLRLAEVAEDGVTLKGFATVDAPLVVQRKLSAKFPGQQVVISEEG